MDEVRGGVITQVLVSIGRAADMGASNAWKVVEGSFEAGGKTATTLAEAFSKAINRTVDSLTGGNKK